MKIGHYWKNIHRLRVFENRVLRRRGLAGGWRKLHNENVTRMIKSIRTRLAGHIYV
jgi:hypothetical protein